MSRQWPQPSALSAVPSESHDVLATDPRDWQSELDAATSFATDRDSQDAEPWGWIEFFVAIQLLWGLLLFPAGMQAVRMYVRALPYVSSLGALIFCIRERSGHPLPASSRWLIASFALLVLNLLHADTHMGAGIAQVIFQISIAAPMFWAARKIRSESRFLRVLWVMFAASFVSAAMGVLQVYYPDRFLPPEFSTLGRALNPEFVDALTYVGAGGRQIIRPPGLSDLPGGAAISGLMTMVLGVVLASHEHRTKAIRMICFASAAVGMTALYLTQVRSLTVMAVFTVLMFAAIRLRQGRLMQAGWIAIVSIGLVAASFMWAAAVGGESLLERFSGLTEAGFFTTFQENRGLFLQYTWDELLFKYPFGAGLGRWGMMQVYFGDSSMWQAPPIHVEIQLTGWLLDGGVLMWLCYGAALYTAIRFAYRVAIHGASDRLQYFATITLSLQLTTVGLCLTGPVFNTQLGIQFWTVSAALFGIAQTWAAATEAEDDSEAEPM